MGEPPDSKHRPEQATKIVPWIGERGLDGAIVLLVDVLAVIDVYGNVDVLVVMVADVGVNFGRFFGMEVCVPRPSPIRA